MPQFQVSHHGVSAAEQWTLVDVDKELAVVGTWEELEKAILSVPKTAGFPNSIATLIAPNGDSLSIGIAFPKDGDNPTLQSAMSSVEYNQASQDPPYLIPVGDPSVTEDDDDNVIVFRFEGEWTEISRRNCVSVDVMLRITHYFFQTGKLPQWIPWEEA